MSRAFVIVKLSNEKEGIHMVRVIWFIIFVLSCGELWVIWSEWFRFIKSKDKTIGKFAGNYLKRIAKSIIPAILGYIGVMAAFLH